MMTLCPNRLGVWLSAILGRLILQVDNCGRLLCPLYRVTGYLIFSTEVNGDTFVS